MNLNLFESSKRTPEAIHRQKLSTRIYLCLLIGKIEEKKVFTSSIALSLSLLGSLFVLLLFTTISERTTSMTYENISYGNYTDLYERYNERLFCPCPELTHLHSSFVTLTANYHPVCSSAFVTDLWFEQLLLKKSGANMLDWRIVSRDYFRLLSTLCEFASETIENGLKEFNQRSIVTTQVINEMRLHHQINETIEQFLRSLNTEVKRVNHILRLLFQVNQYYTQGYYNVYPRIVQFAGAKDYQVGILIDDERSTLFL